MIWLALIFIDVFYEQNADGAIARSDHQHVWHQLRRANESYKKAWNSLCWAVAPV